MTAGVWVVGGPAINDRDDLRYSLRSVAKNAPAITEAWVVGDVPHWFTGTKLQTTPLSGKFENQRRSLDWFTNYPGAPSSFYLFNDDMYVTEPVTELPTCRSKGTVSTWVSSHNDAGHTNACWHCAVNATGRWAAERTGDDPFVYEVHTPLLFNTAKLRDLINSYQADRAFVVGELYPLAGLGGPGSNQGNAKCRQGDSLTTKLSLPMPYLSGNPDTWTGMLGEYIKALFPEPSRWER